MKRLLLILITLTCAQSLQSMDPTPLCELRRTGPEIQKNSSPISFPQIYRYLAQNMNQDIAFYIFSLQFHDKISLQRIKGSCIAAILTTVIQMMLQIKNYSHCFTVELLKQSLLNANESLCDITKSNNETVFHMIADDECLFKNICTETAKVFLEAAGNEVLKLLTTLRSRVYGGKFTALHIAAHKGDCELVRLFLEAAGNNALTLINIKTHQEKTAFDIATPEVQQIMLPYMQNNQ